MDDPYNIPNNDPRYGPIIRYINRRYAQPSNDDIELDDVPEVHESDTGFWVHAWLWAPKDEVFPDADE
jgi:hypothetical protein